MQTHLKEQLLVQTQVLSDSFEPRNQRRRIDYIAENPNPHPYVKKWLEEPWLPALRRDSNFKYWNICSSYLLRSFFNNTNLTKELTESYGTLLKIKEILGSETEDLVFFDVCRLTNFAPCFNLSSGKGYLSCLLSFHFPGCTIYQIDNNTKIKTEHIRSLPNVEFHLIDIKGKKILDLMKRVTTSKRGNGLVLLYSLSKGVLLGIHLCGELSEYMINFYNTIENMKYTAL